MHGGHRVQLDGESELLSGVLLVPGLPKLFGHGLVFGIFVCRVFDLRIEGGRDGGEDLLENVICALQVVGFYPEDLNKTFWAGEANGRRENV